MTDEKRFRMTEDELLASLEEIGVYYYDGTFHNTRAFKAAMDRDIYHARLRSILYDTQRVLLATEGR